VVTSSIEMLTGTKRNKLRLLVSLQRASLFRCEKGIQSFTSQFFVCYYC
jgi:hypothetical protein